ncbi:MAG: enoyl-CoA hydratase-related protein [Chlamydiota bacterium]|nr:enoyl-CoA hydratase-related protein [Chlamydiota bacterium]
MNEELILIDKSVPKVAILTLNRPNKRNALNINLLIQLSQTLNTLNRDCELRVVILKGAGSLFCAGLDLKEASDTTKSTESAKLLAKTFKELYHSPHVTIAAVHGYAIAGGAGLMCACDIAIAEEGTQMGFPETQKGLVASQVSTFLSRQLSQRHLRELLLIGDIIDCNKAVNLGLINFITPQGTLDERSIHLAKKIMRGGPTATRETKKLIDELYPNSFDQDLEKALLHHEKIRNTEEAIEGFLAFNEKRSPNWLEEM